MKNAKLILASLALCCGLFAGCRNSSSNNSTDQGTTIDQNDGHNDDALDNAGGRSQTEDTTATGNATDAVSP